MHVNLSAGTAIEVEDFEIEPGRSNENSVESLYADVVNLLDARLDARLAVLLHADVQERCVVVRMRTNPRVCQAL